MSQTVRRTPLSALAILLLCAGSAAAQDTTNDWAKKMFDSLSHDFGTVARGAEVNHRFKVTNLYKEEMSIVNVTTSCGCTAPKFDQRPVKSLGSTYIDISMDTNRFQREKTSNVTVTVQLTTPDNQVMTAAVVIPVRVYIRTDVVVSPTSFNFGAVEKGSQQQRKMSIAYAGRPDWKISEVVTNNKHLRANLVETMRQNGQIGYDLDLTLLPDAPVGNLRQQILLKTNDADSPEIPILAQASVEADITVTPSVVQFGSVVPGVEMTKTVLFRANRPFVVDKIERQENKGTFKLSELSRDARSVQVLSLSFIAPKQAGEFSEKFLVTIKGRPEPVVFTARGTIETAQQVVPQGK